MTGVRLQSGKKRNTADVVVTSPGPAPEDALMAAAKKLGFTLKPD